MLEMNEEISNKLNGYFEVDETNENENWIRTKIRTFAFGKNRNGSDIINSSMSQFNKAQKSIGGIPIVAKYNESKDDLEGHNVVLRKNKDDEYEIYHDTDALGFTSPTSTFYMEEVNEGSEAFPEYKSYIVIEDVYLWKRFDATKKILEWKANDIPAKVSMEIDSVEGNFDSDGYFSITDFIFTAIAALGSDVEPCFPKAEIQLYTVNDFKADLKQLMYELTTQVNDAKQGGNEQVEENKQEFETTVDTELETQESTENVETEENTEETVVDNEDTVTEEFTEESQTETTEETVAEDFETTEEVVEETVNEFEVKFNDLSAKFDSLEAELTELREFKRNALETELASKFEGQLTDEELAQVFEKSKETAIEDIEKELFALVGKKNFSIKSTKKEKTTLSFNINKVEEENPYGTFFE